MKRIKVNKSHLWNFYVFPLMLFTAVACYPITESNLEMQSESMNEKYFPNGTVIGKYTYVDNEGNPIHVKYYADKASYGVELKSMKVVDSTGEPLLPAVQNVPNKFDSESDAKTAADITNTNNFAFAKAGYKYKNKDPYDILNKKVSKTSRYKVEKPKPDYEIFYQDKLNGPKKCNKEKVRVYFNNKETRNTRSDDNEADMFCEQL